MEGDIPPSLPPPTFPPFHALTPLLPPDRVIESQDGGRRRLRRRRRCHHRLKVGIPDRFHRRRHRAIFKSRRPSLLCFPPSSARHSLFHPMAMRRKRKREGEGNDPPSPHCLVATPRSPSTQTPHCKWQYTRVAFLVSGLGFDALNSTG